MNAAARGILLAVIVALTITALRGWRQNDARDAHAAARRELAATPLAPAGVAPQAGISTRIAVDVPAFPARLARDLANEPDFHRLSHRCGVCHATPDPALHTAQDWVTVVDRMQALIGQAGLLPMSASDRDAVLRVLGRADETVRR